MADDNTTDDGPLDLVHFEEKLRARKTELEELLEIGAQSTQTVLLDQTSVGRLSRMDALQGQAMAQETERRRRLEISRIDAALQRIAEGEYGYCQVTGDPIPKARLELDPAAVTAVVKGR